MGFLDRFRKNKGNPHKVIDEILEENEAAEKPRDHGAYEQTLMRKPAKNGLSAYHVLQYPIRVPGEGEVGFTLAEVVADADKPTLIKAGNIMEGFSQFKELRLGRENSYFRVSGDGLVSRKHGLVYVENGVIKFKDTSSNGTRIVYNKKGIKPVVFQTIPQRKGIIAKQEGKPEKRYPITAGIPLISMEDAREQVAYVLFGSPVERPDDSWSSGSNDVSGLSSIMREFQEGEGKAFHYYLAIIKK